MHEQKEKFNKEIEMRGRGRREKEMGREREGRGEILVLKNTMTELLSTESFNSRLKQAEERIRELKDKPSEPSQLE